MMRRSVCTCWSTGWQWSPPRPSAGATAFASASRRTRHSFGDQVAIHWEGEPGDSRDITYSDLLADVSQAANTLTELGLVSGDRVAISAGGTDRKN